MYVNSEIRKFVSFYFFLTTQLKALVFSNFSSPIKVHKTRCSLPFEVKIMPLLSPQIPGKMQLKSVSNTRVSYVLKFEAQLLLPLIQIGEQLQKGKNNS